MISNCGHCVFFAGKPHEPCDDPGCPCQHGRPWEMSPTDGGFAGYVETLPPEHPDRQRYEAHKRGEVVL